MTTFRGRRGKPSDLRGDKAGGNPASHPMSAADPRSQRRWLRAAVVAGALLLPLSALAQTTPVPTAPAVQTLTDPFAQSVSVGSATYGTDPLCPLAAVLIARQTILNSATVDTLQPIFRTTYGFVPGISFQTADVGLENVKVGQSVCVGKAAS